MLETGQSKEVNVPLVGLQLQVADQEGELRTECVTMTLSEFQVLFGGVITGDSNSRRRSRR